jgi:hypothetical protein
MTDFTFHSIGIAMQKLGRLDCFLKFVEDVFVSGGVTLLRVEPAESKEIARAGSAGTEVLTGAFLWEVGKAYQYLHENVPQWLNSLDQHFLSLPEKLEGGGYGPNN